VIRRAVVLSSGRIRPEHLTLAADASDVPAAAAAATPPVGQSLREMAAIAAGMVERQAIERALRAARGNKTEAAKMLKTDVKTLHLKMKRYGIHAAEFRAS
jgi:DNA-binding NtrC family response regulator